MVTINLRMYYPHCNQDVFVDVPDGIAAQMEQWKRDENTYYVRRRRNRAHYSLDYGDGIENHIILTVESPLEHYEKKLTHKQLHGALASLSGKQAKRIYAHCILGMSKVAIARSEGVGKATVGQSIEKGLMALKTLLENEF